MNHNDKTKILVLGGGYAGTITALRLSRKLRNDRVQITLVNSADHFVERIRFHQQAASQTLKQYPYADLLKDTGVRFMGGWVTGLSPTQRSVTVHTPGGDVAIQYDYLVYALGSMVDNHSVPGAAEHAYTLSTQTTTLALRAQLPPIAARNGRLLICGGGLTGIVAATEFADSYPG